ncbi:choice-of-anchor V domain-containing protein [Parasediminibacterium sp. JCM 36343]|uniref:choice-of-anchor V domain-containing protein n=1 Tax=Parasediminibacterium sp. JCM 36343 TaxID=3374279 RepID=UPI00397B9CA9
MRKTLLVFVSASLFIVIGTSSIRSPKRVSYINGNSVTGYSGGCQSCHAKGTAGSIVLTGIPATTIVGTAYPVTITLSDPGGKRWGFDMSAAKGAFATTNPNAAISGTAALNVHHGTSAPVLTATSYAFDNITWTAPNTPGTVAFKFAGLCANNNGSSSGDKCYSSTFTTTVALPTPVKLASFGVVALGTKAKVSWVTATEINSDYFEIEKSIDGATFTFVGKVSAAGNSSATIAYSYIDDASTFHGTVYYRLKIVDKDGSSTYSTLQSVSLQASKNAITNVYPNPIKAGQDLKLKYTAAKSGSISLQVVDIAGKKISTTAYNVIEGANSLSLKVGNISAHCIYYVVVSSGNTIVQRITLALE